MIPGYAVVHGVIDSAEAGEIAERLAATTGAGSRNILALPWCRDLAGRLRAHEALAETLREASVAVQCTLFDKTPETNWLVALHQDLGIPVAERIEGEGLGPWSVKEGRTFVHAPTDVLETLVAVRLHVDDCGPDNGPLRVVPGSHAFGRLSAEAALRLRNERGEIAVPAERGDAIILKPLLLHASSKAVSAGHRRVLHFLFGPPSIGHGLRWI